MKIPPSPLLPLHSYDDHRPIEPQFASPRKSHVQRPLQAHERAHNSHWLTTIMDRHPTTNQEDEMADATPSNSHKGSLAFILGSPPTETATSAFPQSFLASSSDNGSDTESDQDVKSSPFPVSSKQAKRRRVSLSHPADVAAPNTGSSSSQPPSPERKGSKYCIVDGCTSRAKHARKCWKHGGSVKCKVADCINRAKSKGVCWSHGGGTICSHAQCETIAVSHGFCWAHGGGKRCQVDGCSRPAYERTDNFCSTHYKQHMRAAAKKQ